MLGSRSLITSKIHLVFEKVEIHLSPQVFSFIACVCTYFASTEVVPISIVATELLQKYPTF